MSDPQSFRNGRYLLVERLGEGGMATVWRAFDQRLQVWRAIKVLLPEYATKKKLIARFESEAQTMALLEHPHIVRVYDVDREDDRAFIVMEIIEGGSLVDWQEKHGAMPPRMAVDILVEVCQAVEFAHERGVIHRDIKPHNVLVDRRGVCKITDFGIARAGDDDQGLTKTGAVMGTWGYMAPEQRTDAKHVDRRADVYALAATLYTLITNQAPMDLFAADRDSSILAGLPDALLPVLRKATEYRKEARHASAQELAAAVLAVREALPENPPGTPPLAPESIPVRVPPPKTGPTQSTAPPGPSPHAATPTPPGGRDTILPAPEGAPPPAAPPRPPVSLPTMGYEVDGAPNLPETRRSRPRAGGFGAVLAMVGAMAGAILLFTRQPAAEGTPAAPDPVAASPSAEFAPAAPVVLPVVAPSGSQPALPPPGAATPSEARPPGPATTGTTRPPEVVKPPPEVVKPPPEVVKPPPEVVKPPPEVVKPPPEVEQCVKSVDVPSSVGMGASVPFKAMLCRPGEITLKYRAAGSSAWYTKKMVLRVGMYSALVNVDDAFASGIEWYLVADGVTHGTAGSPKVVKVKVP